MLESVSVNDIVTTGLGDSEYIPPLRGYDITDDVRLLCIVINVISRVLMLTISEKDKVSVPESMSRSNACNCGETISIVTL